MKADRLVSVLLLLQARGRITAAEVATELEISERTARRDLEALSMAGVPVYSQAGRGGGWSLVGGARTDLTGMRAPEARALLLVAGSATHATPQLKTALRKLVQALPEPFREEAEASRRSIVVDPRKWGATSDVVPPFFLDNLQEAIIERRCIRLGYNTPNRGPSERIVHPYGLVTKAGVWYLVAGTSRGQRTFRVDRVTAAEVTDEPARVPEDFDLEAAWNDITTGYNLQSQGFEARVLAVPWTLGPMRSMGVTIIDRGAPNADGRLPLPRASSSPFVLAAKLAGLAAFIEALEPAELLSALADVGALLVARHGPR